jgi:hypothetical protein
MSVRTETAGNSDVRPEGPGLFPAFGLAGRLDQ